MTIGMTHSSRTTSHPTARTTLAPYYGQNIQLKNSLRGMSYEQGATALSAGANSATQQAGATQQDPGIEAKVKRKVANLVSSKFGGDYTKAFNYYKGNNNAISSSELRTMLDDAGFGAGMRWLIASELISRFDTNGSGQLGLSELKAALNG